jgi:DNA invertase Pin-like site-specific DNA recombinase
VYDVSRWGRFQDSDEAACYEFLCKRAGIRVHYCAEAFQNDGSTASAFLKMVKRTMAGEYSRELSAKVLVGQCRLAANGFKIGGRAGFGLRRLLLDCNGRPKMVLQDGEHKNLQSDRVTYTLGPEEEVRVVREIYSMFLDQNFAPHKIARLLNERGVRYGQFGPWQAKQIGLILTHPKYTGCAVFNRTTMKLKGKTVANAREQWVVKPNVFAAIIPQDVFDRVQTKLDNIVCRRSNERLLEDLRGCITIHGRPFPAGNHAPNMASATTYHYRFGGRMEAYKLIGYHPARCTPEVVENRRKVAALRSEVIDLLRQGFLASGVQVVERKWRFRVRGHGNFMVATARSYETRTGPMRWKVTNKRLPTDHGVIVIRLQRGNASIRDFVLYKKAPITSWGFTLPDTLPESETTIHQSVADLIEAIAAR